ncbi:MAG: tRNA lysidine(34) synthetase TilS [Lachnospiraceae bacterium]|jgi:tRNA(Ile)-lysidine synthase|nr:tRNA lysidine(34) synthetase TilS [Lachnospiraceae bacterium]
MRRKISEFMQKHHMAEEGDCILAAVSGGADSLCLLLILLNLQQTMKFRLCAVHVEHGIRGEGSRADALFVENFCKEHQVPCRVFHCNALEYSRKHKMTVEEGARNLRYGFFDQAAGEFGADKIAVAHNRNDCAETMLFHLARGTGLKGMCGILPVRGKIIRPLLCVQRREIEAYLASVRQPFCMDKTNEELDYTRNRLRRQVFPVLEEVNSQAVVHMNQAAELSAEILELMEDLTREARNKYAQWEKQGCLILAELGKERPVLQKSLLHLILTELAGGGKDISSLHVQKLRELFDRQVGRCLDFPYDIRAERVYQGIILRKCTGEEGRKQNFPELTARGFWQIPGYGYEIRTRLIEKNFQNEEIPKKMYTKWMDYDKIKGTMQLRTRQEQDFLVLGPDGRRKKLKKYFVDEKIPRQERDRILLLADGSHILWVIGYRISEEIKVTEHTRRILEIQVDGGTAYE